MVSVVKAPRITSIHVGSTSADAQLLGREYYLPSEKLTIYLPLALHLSSAVIKRAILAIKTRRLPPLTPHIVTGWMMPFLLLPHIASHRLRPSSSKPPISGLSPSELGMEFVGWGINRWPVWSYLSYGALVGVMSWHAGVGMMKVMSWLRGRKGPVGPSAGTTEVLGTSKRTSGDSIVSAEERVGAEPAASITPAAEQPIQPMGRKISKERKIGLRSILLVFVGIVGVGLARIARESRYVSRVMALRYEAVYA